MHAAKDYENHGGNIVGGPHGSGSSLARDDLMPQLSEEEEQRIIAEEWEKFKTEHAAALWAELKGLSEQEIEGFEQEMLQQRDDYDPSYDMLLEQEQHEMQYAIEEYLHHQDTSSQSTTSSSLSIAANGTFGIEDEVLTLLAGQPCFRCLKAPFHPLQEQQQPHTAGHGQTATREMACPGCGYRLSGDVLQYIANVARHHR
ncbi:hypothetical protein DFQ26_001165 [Actinomortierella ambigua]|nr:hypothetical protein DFQ26_001165 [Actinomortierella ambigua]